MLASPENLTEKPKSEVHFELTRKAQKALKALKTYDRRAKQEVVHVDFRNFFEFLVLDSFGRTIGGSF